MIVRRGDIFFADLNGLENWCGSEQTGERPVLVIQNDKGNMFSNTIIVAIITSKIKKVEMPTHVRLPLDCMPQISEVHAEQIKTIDKIKLKEDKELIIEMKKESNIKEKELKRKKLIEDTLYVPLNFINKNKVYFTNTISYDMNDVISTIYEIWIELIDAEILVSIDKYSNIFNYNSLFYTKLLDKLPIAKYSFERVVVLNTTNFAEILINYIKLKEITPEVTYNKYLDFIKKELNKNKDFFKYFPGYYCLYSIYTLLEAITNKLTEVDSSKLSKEKIDKLKYLLIDSGLTDSIQTFEESLPIDILTYLSFILIRT